MFKQSAAITILAACFLTAGCSDTDAPATATGPAALKLTSSTFATINPSDVTAQLNGRPNCPVLQPLRVTANLVVLADDDVTLFLNEVRLRFTDRGGLAGPQVTLPAPMLTSQFGTALIEARSSRRFPLDFSFGCSTDRTGTLTVNVRARDGRGRDRSAEIQVAVR